MYKTIIELYDDHKDYVEKNISITRVLAWYCKCNNITELKSYIDKDNIINEYKNHFNYELNEEDIDDINSSDDDNIVNNLSLSSSNISSNYNSNSSSEDNYNENNNNNFINNNNDDNYNNGNNDDNENSDKNNHDKKANLKNNKNNKNKNNNKSNKEHKNNNKKNDFNFESLIIANNNKLYLEDFNYYKNINTPYKLVYINKNNINKLILDLSSININNENNINYNHNMNINELRIQNKLLLRKKSYILYYVLKDLKLNKYLLKI